MKYMKNYYILPKKKLIPMIQSTFFGGLPLPSTSFQSCCFLYIAHRLAPWGGTRTFTCGAGHVGLGGIAESQPLCDGKMWIYICMYIYTYVCIYILNENWVFELQIYESKVKWLVKVIPEGQNESNRTEKKTETLTQSLVWPEHVED